MKKISTFPHHIVLSFTLMLLFAGSMQVDDPRLSAGKLQTDDPRLFADDQQEDDFGPLTFGRQVDDYRYAMIRGSLARFTESYPQQKAYLHTDKEEYYAGEVMWIKAYLLNGINHHPDSLSMNLYIEVLSPDGSRINAKRLMMIYGSGTGHIALSDTLPEGLYQLRAYTSWMQNFNGDYYFSRNFQIRNPAYAGIISPREARDNVREISRRNRLDADFDIQFLPEGGSLVAGLESVVAFKAVNQLGMGIDVEGEVYDDRDNRIVSFVSLHKGMGTFVLTPQPRRKYHVLVRSGDEQVKVQLPAFPDRGTVIHVEDGQQEIRVTLRRNQIRTNDQTANEVVVTGQVRNVLYYHSIQDLSEGQVSFTVEKSLFPSGIVQLTVFTGRGEPLAERLVFADHEDRMNLKLLASDILTGEGVQTRIDIRALDQDGKPLLANLSLAVVRQLQEKTPPNHEDMISYLLLASDLTGYIEDPSFYFQAPSEFTRKALDVLMLTHGWRRFSWQEILAGNYPEIRYFEENGIVIDGRIVHDFFDIPLRDCRVDLTITDQFNDVFTEYTGEGGYFRFDNLFYYDTVSVRLEAWRKSGRRNLVILLPDEEVREAGKFIGEYTLTTVSVRDNRAYRREQGERDRIAFREQEEAEENADNNRLEGIHGRPDNILKGEDIPQGTRNVLEAMNGRIPGVNIQGDNVMIRGPNSFYSSTQPLFLVDNLPIQEIETIKSIPIETIDRIEVIKGPQAAIYGVRGGNGVIAIYTKRSQFMVRGVIEFDILGYSTPRTFYIPKYLPGEEPADNYTVLWEPEIRTSANGTAYFMMDKQAIEGDYRFVLQGVSGQGHIGFFDAVIENQL